MRKSKIIYLDYAASVTANPSSIHALGTEAKKKLENARREVAEILGARREEIIFTGSGTESNNLAIQGAVFAWHEKNHRKILPHIVTTNIEHPSVLETCRMLERRKLAHVSVVPVGISGVVDPKKIRKEIVPSTVLVSVMYANNEIGTIEPIREIAKEIRHYRKHSGTSFPLFHTDAVQAVNCLGLNVEKLGVDMLSLSGSKIEGAGRVGVLYKKKSLPIAPIWGGGDQEWGLRPGTENLPEILKFSEALRKAEGKKKKENERLTKLRDHFIKKLSTLGVSNTENSSGVGHLNGDIKNRLPNNINVTFPKIPSDLLVVELSSRGIMASSKSACKSSKAEGSYVIKAICPRTKTDIGGIRFSMGRATTMKDIDETIRALSQILAKLGKWY